MSGSVRPGVQGGGGGGHTWHPGQAASGCFRGNEGAGGAESPPKAEGLELRVSQGLRSIRDGQVRPSRARDFREQYWELGEGQIESATCHVWSGRSGCWQLKGMGAYTSGLSGAESRAP